MGRGYALLSLCRFPPSLLSPCCYVQQRINSLRENGNFFRQKLKEMGFRVIGSEDSPVIPLMLFHPAKIAGFSRAALEENVSLPSSSSSRFI
jgi:7-keto-8-aminopelargonate synthetase-like enzyme